MFLLKSESTTTESFHSTMLRIITRLSFQENYSCKFKKNFKEEQTLEPEMPIAKGRGFTAANMLYRPLSFVASVEICTEELLGVQRKKAKVKSVDELKKYLINFWYKKYLPLKEENRELKKQLKKCEIERVRYRDMAERLSKQKQILYRNRG